MPGLSTEARFAVYLLDPGPNRPAAVSLMAEILGPPTEAAAACAGDTPALVTYCEDRVQARAMTERFRAVGALAVVRTAGQAPPPLPVAEVDVPPQFPWLRRALLLLAGAQLGLCALWLHEGRHAAAFFGLLLAAYVLLYFGPRRS